MCKEPDLPRTVALIVEDEMIIAEGLKSSLEAMGCEVLGPAPNCSAAIEVLWHQMPDVAFVDTQLGRNLRRGGR
jgi:YesN/AraC family two-component response regulator